MQQVVVDGGDVQKVLGEAALVFLYLEIVFVLGKILGHGNEFVTDFVPHGQRLACAGERRTGSLSLHLVLGGEPRSSDRKQGKRNERKAKPSHPGFSLASKPPGRNAGLPGALINGSTLVTRVSAACRNQSHTRYEPEHSWCSTIPRGSYGAVSLTFHGWPEAQSHSSAGIPPSARNDRMHERRQMSPGARWAICRSPGAAAYSE